MSMICPRCGEATSFEPTFDGTRRVRCTRCDKYLDVNEAQALLTPDSAAARVAVRPLLGVVALAALVIIAVVLAFALGSFRVERRLYDVPEVRTPLPERNFVRDAD